MRTKLILWAKKENDERVLAAIELVESENAVKTHLISEEDATEEFYNLLLNEWRFDKEVEFPKNFETITKPLTAAEDILPDGILVEKPDLISRAKTEWHFVVLSKKLYDLYKDELDDIKEKIANLTEFNSEYWEDLKQFWIKVQKHIRERNLFRNHGESLKRRTDELFNELKQFRKQEEAKIREKSQVYYEEFGKILNDIDEKIEKGFGLQPLFEELKDIQRRFSKINFSRDHRRKLWSRIDKAFKIVKEKRFGNTTNDKNSVSRTERRYKGLLGAIDRMKTSIDRDKRDMDLQNDLAGESGGQLEIQLREARVAMIQERISSKQEKFEDMLKTKAMLEERMEKEKRREEERLRLEKAKQEAKAKIKEKVIESNKVLEENEEELIKASKKIKDSKIIKEKADAVDSIVDKAGDIIEDVADKIEDVVDKVEDVAETIIDKLKETVKEVKEKLDEEE